MSLKNLLGNEWFLKKLQVSRGNSPFTEQKDIMGKTVASEIWHIFFLKLRFKNNVC